MFCLDVPGLFSQVPAAIVRKLMQRQGVILLKRRHALGDRLMMTPLARALRLHCPELHVALAARVIDVFHGNPRFDELRCWHVWKSADTVNPDYDPALERPHFVRQMWLQVWEHLVRRGLAEGDRPDLDITPEIFLSKAEMEWGQRAVRRTAPSRPVVALISGGKTSRSWNREWGLANFCELAAVLSPHADLVQIAGEKPISWAPGRTVRLIPANVRQAAAVLASCDVFVTQEGGLMHLARAVSAPTVAIFGGAVLPWMSGYDEIMNLWSRPECSPCLGLRRNCAHLKCMRPITVRRVAQHVADILAKRGFVLPEEAMRLAPDTWTPPSFLSGSKPP